MGCGCNNKSTTAPATLEVQWDIKPDTYGTCHICRNYRPVTYCERCKHWFCTRCERRWIRRALGAIKQYFVGRKPNCCGPR